MHAVTEGLLSSMGTRGGARESGGRSTIARVMAAPLLLLGLAACSGGSAVRTTPASATTSAASPSSTARAPSSLPTAPRAPAAGGLTVAPRATTATATVRFSFRGRWASGRQRQTTTFYTLSVAGPPGGDCVTRQALRVTVPSAGAEVTAPLGPAELGGQWCVGQYTARVLALAQAGCDEQQPCADFPRLLAIIGPATFRITG